MVIIIVGSGSMHRLRLPEFGCIKTSVTKPGSFKLFYAAFVRLRNDKLIIKYHAPT